MKLQLLEVSSGLRTKVSGLVVVRRLPNRPKEDNVIDHMRIYSRDTATLAITTQSNTASVAEWSIATGCKPVGFILHKFESCPAHIEEYKRRPYF